MRVLVINLDRASERLAHVTAAFGEARVPFERVAAIDGRGLTSQEIARWRRGTPHFYELAAGEIACFLSHRECWKMIAAGDAPTAIFEDDVHLGSEVNQIIESVAWLPPDAEIVRLETTLSKTCFDRRPASRIAGRQVVRLRGRHTGTAGYIVTSGGAAKLLEKLTGLADPLDQVMFNPASALYAELTTYQLIPGACVQDETLNWKRAPVTLKSDLQGERRLPKRRGLAKFQREMRRPFEQIAAKAVELSINLIGDRRYAIVPFE